MSERKEVRLAKVWRGESRLAFIGVIRLCQAGWLDGERVRVTVERIHAKRKQVVQQEVPSERRFAEWWTEYQRVNQSGAAQMFTAQAAWDEAERVARRDEAKREWPPIPRDGKYETLLAWVHALDLLQRERIAALGAEKEGNDANS